MHCIIFSFNRACQLNALLESMRRFLKNIHLEINVVYNSSDDFYEEGYAIVKSLYPEVTFIKEEANYEFRFLLKKEYGYWRNYYNFFKYPAKNKKGSFKKNVNELIEANDSDLLFFLTDDSLFIGEPFISSDVTENIVKNPSQSMFSFRHGLNLAGRPKESLLEFDKYAHYKVDRTHSPHWKYKFSVDGHIYNREFIKNISSKIFYYNPNSFESFLNTYSEMRNYFENIYFNKGNSLVGFELNRVQSFCNNNNLNYSPNKLNSYFLRGYKLKYLFDMVNDFRPGLQGLEFRKNDDMFQIRF